MTTDEWLEKTLADRPPLSREQIARLRPIFTPAQTNAAPAADKAGTAPDTETLTTPEGTPQ